MTTPTKRTLDFIRRQQGTLQAQVVERWVPTTAPKAGKAKGGGGVRKDLFGIIDIVSIHQRENTTLNPSTTAKIVGWQACGYTGIAAHWQKMLDTEATHQWLETGAELILIGWQGKPMITKDGTPAKPIKKKDGTEKPRKVWVPSIWDVRIGMMGEITRTKRKPL